MLVYVLSKLLHFVYRTIAVNVYYLILEQLLNVLGQIR